MTDQEVQTAYVKRIITTFKGEIADPPLLDLSNEEEIQNNLEALLAGEEPNFLDYSVTLYKNPTQLMLRSEYYQLDQRYSISKYSKELPICVIATGRNVVRNRKYLKFLMSIENQNYTNYRLFLTDDASPDGSYNTLKAKIKELPRLRTRTTLIKNYQRIGALGNKCLSIVDYC